MKKRLKGKMEEDYRINLEEQNRNFTRHKDELDIARKKRELEEYLRHKKKLEYIESQRELSQKNYEIQKREFDLKNAEMKKNHQKDLIELDEKHQKEIQKN